MKFITRKKIILSTTILSLGMSAAGCDSSGGPSGTGPSESIMKSIAGVAPAELTADESAQLVQVQDEILISSFFLSVLDGDNPKSISHVRRDWLNTLSQIQNGSLGQADKKAEIDMRSAGSSGGEFRLTGKAEATAQSVSNGRARFSATGQGQVTFAESLLQTNENDKGVKLNGNLTIDLKNSGEFTNARDFNMRLVGVASGTYTSTDVIRVDDQNIPTEYGEPKLNRLKNFGLSVEHSDDLIREIKEAKMDPLLNPEEIRERQIEILEKVIKCQGQIQLGDKVLDCAPAIQAYLRAK